MTAYVVMKLSYASGHDLDLGSDPLRAFPRLPTPPFVFHHQREAINRACALAKDLPSHEAGTVEYMVLETKQGFRAPPGVPAPTPRIEADNNLANALMLALNGDD